ncbi:MAG TPA: AraC family transcriptional regulator [Actinocrinis sp.]|nr:AraC family transcriptional regulator [Actinocrinis sp.]
MDVLTEALGSMRTGHPSSVLTQARAPFGLRLPPVMGAGFHVVLRGSCWLLPLEAAGSELRPIALSAGDVVFLRDGRGHILADDPATPAAAVVAPPTRAGSPIGCLRVGGTGAPASLLCGNYHLDQARAHPLVSQLPEIVHLRPEPGRHPELTAAVQLLRAELENPRIGSDGIVPALIDSLLLYILRAWLGDQPAAAKAGWAAALRDPGIAPALAAIHEDPAAGWTVELLAVRAGLSRAAFARRFAALVGEPPLAYLTRWRMTTAARLLRESDAPLSTVAAHAGYGSEFAFAKAFKREYGLAPGGYRHQARVA